MKPGTHIASLAVLLVLAGCASIQGGQGKTPACNESVCHVTISVGTDCQITAYPSTLEVRQTKVEIHWDIATSDYAFDTNGIVVEHDQKQEFSGGHIAEQGRKFVLNDKNSFSQTYKYDVHVKSGDQVCSIDPWIYNN